MICAHISAIQSAYQPTQSIAQRCFPVDDSNKSTGKETGTSVQRSLRPLLLGTVVSALFAENDGWHRWDSTCMVTMVSSRKVLCLYICNKSQPTFIPDISWTPIVGCSSSNTIACGKCFFCVLIPTLVFPLVAAIWCPIGILQSYLLPLRLQTASTLAYPVPSSLGPLLLGTIALALLHAENDGTPNPHANI